MRVLLRNLWLLLAGVAGWCAHLWVATKNERLIPLSDAERVVDPLGLALSAGTFAVFLICTLWGKDLLAWLLPAHWHLREPPASPAARPLRLALTGPTLGGLFYLAVHAILLVRAPAWPAGDFSERRWEALSASTLRLDVRELAQDIPSGAKRVALLLAPGESDEQDRLDARVLAYEIFPIRSEEHWAGSCTQGPGAGLALGLDAVLYQCDRGDAYRWIPAKGTP